jgi:hypothetical protein
VEGVHPYSFSTRRRVIREVSEMFVAKKHQNVITSTAVWTLRCAGVPGGRVRLQHAQPQGERRGGGCTSENPVDPFA